MSGALRVAVVGTGPAGAYAAGHLLQAGAEVTLLDRRPVPWGLVRGGVAPDHASTKRVTDSFEWVCSAPGSRLLLGVDVGRDVTHADLLRTHHAVLYAVGAPGSRRLGIPGEELAGCLGATDFVAWYNGAPEAAGLAPDLSHERAIVVGNGNVALDVARVLLRDVEELRRTDIADHALETLSRSAVREVVVLGRRGPAQAAFTTPELLGLRRLSGIDVVCEPANVVPPDVEGEYGRRLKTEVLREIEAEGPTGAERRIVLRFLAAPVEVLSDDGRVTGLRVQRTELDAHGNVVPTDDVEQFDAGLVVRSVGYQGQAVSGLPFDETRSVVPNVDGRVVDGDDVVAGAYVAGWIKRGPSGVIGTNKHCSARTVRALLEDHAAARLPEPVAAPAELDRLLAGRGVTLDGWRSIDAHERARGEEQGRPRVKVCDDRELLTLAGAGTS